MYILINCCNALDDPVNKCMFISFWLFSL